MNPVTDREMCDECFVRLSWATWWGVLGFLAILAQAIVRLFPLAMEPISQGILSPWQWGLLIVSIVFNGYFEGYRGFHQQAAPRVVARGLALTDSRSRLHHLLAPFFCMSLFHATRKRLIVSWCLYVGIVLLIVIVRMLPQPWRGIVDAGVVVGLTMGAFSVLWFLVRAAQGHHPGVAAELPEAPNRPRS